MFILTYALIDAPDHFYFNVNRFYMALLMAAPLVALILRPPYRPYSCAASSKQSVLTRPCSCRQWAIDAR